MCRLPIHKLFAPAACASVLFLASCGILHQRGDALVKQKTLIKECERGWVSYKIYLLPEPESESNNNRTKAKSEYIRLCVMVINKDGFRSPLRAISTSRDQYDSYYEYLLNDAKNDLVLVGNNELKYPTYYAFENNYNAFPFETINVGYRMEKRMSVKKMKGYRFLFLDKVFAHDTLTLNLAQACQQL